MTHERGVLSPPKSERRDPYSTERVAEQHFKSGEEALHRGEYERAASEFTYSIQLNPNRGEAFSRRGDVWRVLGRSESAVADYSACLQMSPENEAVLLSRGHLYALAGLHRLAADDFTAAIALARSPNPTAHQSRGQALAKLGEYPTAIADFTKTIELSPGNAFAYLERGTVQLETGSPSDAIQDLTRAIQLNPYLWLALSRRAEAHARLSQQDRAISDLTDALRLDPLNPALFIARGECQIRLDQTLSLADFDEAIRLAPGNPEWWARRGLACLTGGRLKQAEEDLTTALKSVPENVPWLRARADARLKLNQLDLSMSDYVEVTKRTPIDGEGFLGQALVYISRGDYGMALPHLDRAIGYSPELMEAYYQRARCHHRSERIEQALEDASRAIDLDPAQVLPRRLRAELYLRVGRAEEAYNDIAQLVNRAPTDPIIYHLRGKLEFRRKRSEAAITDFTTALKLNPQFTEARADRAAVYRSLSKHKEALADLTIAVHQESKYAAEYVVQLGILRGAMGEFNGAIADFIVALHIDPANKAAIRAKELVTQLRDVHGSPNSSAEECGLVREILPERTLGLSDTKRPENVTWRSAVHPEQISAPASAALNRSRTISSRASVVGVVLEPEPDIDLLPNSDEENTEFELTGGFEETAEMGSETESEELMVEKDESTVPARARPRTSLRPQKPKKTKPPVARSATNGAANHKSKGKVTERTKPDFDSAVAKKVSEPAPRPEIKTAPNPVIATTPIQPALARATSPKPFPRRSNWDDDDDSEGRFKRFLNSKWGKRVCLPLGAITLMYLLYLGFDALFEPSASDIAAKAKDIGYPVSQDNVFSSQQLWDEYARDNTAANRRFTDSFIEVSGKVRTVITDKKLAVVLETPSSEAGIVCLFPVKDYFEGVKVGDQVTIQGEGCARIAVNTDVELNICKIKPKK